MHQRQTAMRLRLGSPASRPPVLEGLGRSFIQLERAIPQGVATIRRPSDDDSQSFPDPSSVERAPPNVNHPAEESGRGRPATDW